MIFEKNMTKKKENIIVFDFYDRGSSERIFAKKTDGYKPSHWMFYEEGITQMYDYLTSRGGMFDKLMMFGAQAHAIKYLCNRVITPKQVERARKFYTKYFGMDNVFNHDGWMDIATRLDGHLPIELCALPEGLSDVPVQTPMLAYYNTDPKHAWLCGYLEPLIFKVWNPITVASLSQHIKKVIYQFLQETGTPKDIVWKLHDFGYRGVSSEESAEYAGAAHLVNFMGSDTIPAIDFVNEFYSDGDFDKDGDPIYMPAFSVRATEHSVMTHRGRVLEEEVVRDILTKCPTGIIAMVGDSYNIFDFAEKILGTDLHTEVVERDGIVVIRPDSGDPISTMMKLLWILGEKFGYTTNEKGYRVLNHVRTLQGDKNDYDAIYNMLRALKGGMWSADNIATFGMGGALLQASTRDTQNMAVKLSSLTDKWGNWRGVYKDPVNDPGKGSKAGRFAVVKEDGRIVTKVLKQGEPVPENNLLRPIFRNGKLLIHDDFETVRRRADEWMQNV
jgi:nicotinamide phosphoribosyltransferase